MKDGVTVQNELARFQMPPQIGINHLPRGEREQSQR
jgi:hypothetical protein